MGGKTSVVKTLAQALEIHDKMCYDLEKEQEKPENSEAEALADDYTPMMVQVHSINPKSVSIG